MTQDTTTYYAWIGGSCDYGHKERVGGAAIPARRRVLLRYAARPLHVSDGVANPISFG